MRINIQNNLTYGYGHSLRSLHYLTCALPPDDMNQYAVVIHVRKAA
jgi:hypothetical protein